MEFLKPDKILEAYGLKIKQYILHNHNVNNIPLPSLRTYELIGSTVHNTAAINAAKGTTMAEQYTRATVNGNMNTVVPHFYVDDVESWQLLSLKYEGWHAGSKKNGRTESDAHGSQLGNKATIGIEVIGDSPKSQENAARLVAYLMDTYGFTSEQIYTHSYWVNIRRGVKANPGEDLRTKPDGYKGCPIYIIPKWNQFITQVESFRKSQIQNAKLFYVQTGAFASENNAKSFLNEVQKKYPNAFIKKVNNLFYVQVGAFSCKDNAEKYLDSVKSQYPKAFIKTF